MITKLYTINHFPNMDEYYFPTSTKNRRKEMETREKNRAKRKRLKRNR